MPGVVEVSQYNKPDSLLVLFSTTSVLVTLVYLDRGGRGLALAAGAVVGFTVAVKYNAALLLIPFFLAVTFRRGIGIVSTSDLYLGVVCSILGFTVGCPYFLRGSRSLPRSRGRWSVQLRFPGARGRLRCRQRRAFNISS